MKSPLNRGGLRFYLVTTALAAGTLLARTTTPATILAGLPCLLAGVWLHTWAKGCLRQNRAVAMSGPYRFLRHPLYLANALIDAGLVVMAGWWPLAVVLPLWWAAIYIPVIRGEERYLCETFPDEYPAYRRRVACLIPWRRPLPRSASGQPGSGFQWTNPNIAGGEELPRAARILAYPLLFFVVQGLGAHRLPWLREGWNLTGLAGLIMLYVLAAELQGHQRQRRWILPAALRRPLMRVVAGAAVLAAVNYVTGPKTAFQNYVPLSGAVLVLLSVPVYARRPMRAIAAEVLALLGVIAAGELLWLAPALVVIYAAWLLDYRLSSTTSPDGPGEGQESPLSRPGRGAGREGDFWPYFYPLLAVAAAAEVGVKLVGHGLPYHSAIF